MVNERGPGRRGVGFFGWFKRLIMLLVLAALGYGGWWYYQFEREKEILNQIIDRLTTDRRVAEVYVEQLTKGESGERDKLRLKILEYDVDGKPLAPVHCTFSLNDVIHFEALVIRLSDEIVKGGEGKSIHLFRRAFALEEGGNTYESCELTRPEEVPGGYRLPTGDKRVSELERRYWQGFWRYALDVDARTAAEVRNAQIEAPATRFVPEKIYHIQIEARGGLTIEAGPIPEVLKGPRPKIESAPNPEHTP